MSDEEEEELYEESEEESELNEPEDQEVIEEFCREDEPIEPPEIEKVMKFPIAEIHPQEKMCNYDEVLSLCNITRDDAHNIIDPYHTTIPILTKYEYTRILGVRATQIENGAPTFIDVHELVDSYLIAKAELEQKKIPFILKRPIPNGNIEYWKLEDLEIL
jgi:DNA-directed RNA polymerase subunit K/omega